MYLQGMPRELVRILVAMSKNISCLTVTPHAAPVHVTTSFISYFGWNVCIWGMAPKIQFPLISGRPPPMPPSAMAAVKDSRPRWDRVAGLKRKRIVWVVKCCRGWDVREILQRV